MTKKEFDLFVEKSVQVGLGKKLDYDIRFVKGLEEIEVTGEVLLDGLESVCISWSTVTCKSLLDEINKAIEAAKENE